jgi:Holliday junction DNA helicase RuvA
VICRLAGKLLELRGEAAVLEVGGVGYEVLLPTGSAAELAAQVGQELALHTLQYFEGNPAGANLVPRLVGFLTAADREFFQLFTRVKGISTRRALRAMCVPVAHLAAAIEGGDTRVLTSLPEIGKKTAQQVIAELQGKCQGFLVAPVAATPMRALTEAQRVALEILVQWGDRRAEAQRWIAAAVEADPALTEPDAIVRAAYRAKTAG